MMTRQQIEAWKQSYLRRDKPFLWRRSSRAQRKQEQWQKMPWWDRLVWNLWAEGGNGKRAFLNGDHPD